MHTYIFVSIPPPEQEAPRGLCEKFPVHSISQLMVPSYDKNYEDTCFFEHNRSENGPNTVQQTCQNLPNKFLNFTLKL